MNEFLYNLTDYRIKKKKLAEYCHTRMRVKDNMPESKNLFKKAKLLPVISKDDFISHHNKVKKRNKT